MRKSPHEVSKLLTDTRSARKDQGYGSVAEHLIGNHEVMSSIPSRGKRMAKYYQKAEKVH